MDPSLASSTRRHLIAMSTHQLSPSMSSFVGFGSEPFQLYNSVSFDNVHLFDLGIIRQFCDCTHSVIRNSCSLQLTRAMALINYFYSALRASDRLSTHRPFQTILDESQAGISGQIRRESAPFLWACIMGIA